MVNELSADDTRLTADALDALTLVVDFRSFERYDKPASRVLLVVHVDAGKRREANSRFR